MAHKWLLNRHAFKDQWQNFEHNEMSKFENAKNLETQLLFPNENHKNFPLKKSGLSLEEKFKYNESGGCVQ